MQADDSAPITGSGTAAAAGESSGFPFKTELSLRPLIDFWTRAGDDASPACAAIARLVGEQIQQTPGLTAPITDLTILERHGDLVDLLMSAEIPPALWEQAHGAAMVPFHLQAVYATPAMRRDLMLDDGRLRGHFNADAALVDVLRRAHAYALVLHRLYGIGVELDYPVILTVADRDTGLDRHFRLLFDGQFVEVDVVGGAPPVLTDEVREHIRGKLLDGAYLEKVLPPDRFVLRGVSFLKAIEVTDQEVLSALKRDLIDRESIVSEARFAGLQGRLRTLFRRPELRLSLAALDGERVLIVNSGARIEHACIFADSVHHRKAEFAGTVYERAVQSGRPVLVENLAALEGRTAIEDHMVAGGIRTLMVAPLHYQGRVIGTLDLDSPRAGDLDASHLPKLSEVLPLFAMAVQRSMEELNTRIQTQIKERFTAIHPVVEWRFRKAVLDGLEQAGDPAAAELEPIVFENVYPLYALSDIRGSSTQRARAIQADLLSHLDLARAVVEAAYAARRLPALDQLRYRIDQHAEQIREHLAAGDEVGIVTFLHAEVERLLDRLASFGEPVAARVAAYRDALDPRLGTVYRQRKIFEQSMTRLTEAISAYLELEEQAAQAIFPHYFEKQKTDGVDHQIYVGGSLVEDGGFDPLYLKSLRLWQLMVLCGVAARTDRLAGELPLPLRATHLVLVQHAPLSIRFRFDEKRFDVDGAYDIRYEIVKKRIDKALIKGTAERVTQPGRLAVVYGQPAEAQEYRGYLEYLRHLGYISGEVEELELEELQGVHGLRALRVSVALRDSLDGRPLAADTARTAR
ncbi:MAG TPA: GAF domain-containing protein [Methylomirabilota bacterium]|nr:GAF domain-containing protein [Methylomirabilota bacterium]